MSYLTSKIEPDLFDEMRGMGDLPANAQPIAQIASYRGRFPRLTRLSTLSSGGVTHFTVTTGTTTAQFRFFGATGTMKGSQELPLPQSELQSGPVEPQKDTVHYQTPVLAPLPGDGLLPSEPGDSNAPAGAARWLPWALLGGAALVGGGLIFTVARSRRPVAANRRRRRRSRRTR